MRWNRKTILDEIRELHRRGDELNFSAAEENHLNLVRAASWHYGTWKGAVELAGFDYEAVSKYRRWSRERVLQAIRDHYAAGHDLSWRSISTAIDPPLAAAALRPGVGFETWREAVTAAGISHDEVARYRHWTPDRVIEEIAAIAQKNQPLSSKIVQGNNQPLYCAARRRFKSWNSALEAAGIDPQTVRLRRAPRENLPLDFGATAKSAIAPKVQKTAIDPIASHPLQSAATPKVEKVKGTSAAKTSSPLEDFSPDRNKKLKEIKKRDKGAKKPQKIKASKTEPATPQK
ncbi:hypothetical protein B1R32_10287 [Abditibacterium utsteinense]|uniref:Uncharacterized protein n=1 Tax=Abditibacterium utsteinense TaxID=1960156 RepID=A0A2S8SWA5_9BACT|nr:hypothetical protein [Abditibacterium utsteinense]PQV65080.1 hypothetical protein B1R32_10287 [Abditibacterium utsteinense]